MSQFKQTAQSGDLVQLVGLSHKNFIIQLQEGEVLETHRGILAHDDLIGKQWGSQVTAIIQLRKGEAPSEAELKATANEHITKFKLPKAFIFVDELTRAPSGKADYRWAKETAERALGL